MRTTMIPRRSCGGLIAALLGLFACGDDPYDTALEVGAPVGTRTSVVWPDQTYQELLFAVPQDDELALLRVALGDGDTRIAWIQPDLAGENVLAMVVPASEKIEGIDDRLMRVAADGRSEAVEIPVRAPFSSIALGPDGRRAVLHFGGGPGAGVLQNQNQVALVDLGDDSVRDLTLNGFGGRLGSVHFPAADGLPVRVGPVDREILAFLADGEIVLVDAADPELDQAAVRFFPDVPFTPSATLLRRGNALYEAPVLFLRSDTSNDVAMLTLVDRPDEVTGAPGFSAQVSLVPVGGGASDFLTHDGDETPFLVTVSGSTLAFTDIRTQQGFTIALDAAVGHLRLRTSETVAGPTPQLLAWANGGGIVYQLDLDGIEDALGRTPQRLTINGGIDALVSLDNDRALVGSGNTLYVLDFARSQVTPLTSTVPYDAASSALSGNQLLLGTPGQSWVSTVDLATLDPESMQLDEPIERFFHLPDAGKLMIVHTDAVGFVTVADATAPSRSTSTSRWGLFLGDLLERR
jgi:hypothetical protein